MSDVVNAMQGRPGPDEYNAYYGRYISRLPDGDLVRILAVQGDETVGLLRSDEAAEREDFRYAPDKWSLKEVIGHIIDTERIMSYRALRIARGDATPLPGFDEKTYTPAGEFSVRTLDSLTEEFSTQRRATLALFAGLPPHTWEARGTASDSVVSVRALACIIAGHELHHREILLDRYLASETTA